MELVCLYKTANILPETEQAVMNSAITLNTVFTIKPNEIILYNQINSVSTFCPITFLILLCECCLRKKRLAWGNNRVKYIGNLPFSFFVFHRRHFEISNWLAEFEEQFQIFLHNQRWFSVAICISQELSIFAS